MEESTKYAEAKQVKKRKHRPLIVAQSPAEKTHIMIPAMCSTAIYRLRGELGLSSCGAAIQWLVHNARPDLIPAPEPLTMSKSSKTCPSRKTDSVDHDSIPKPTCMAREDVDAPVFDFPVTSPAARLPVRATVVQALTVFFDTPATLAYGSQLVVFPEAFVGGYPRCVRFDATNLTEEDDSLQRYYASAIDVPEKEHSYKKQSEINSSVNENHIRMTANGSNPFLSTTEMKTKAPEELSEYLSCVEHASCRKTFSSPTNGNG